MAATLDIDWEAVYQAYSSSGLTGAEFLRHRMVEFSPDGKIPCESCFFRNVRAVKKKTGDSCFLTGKSLAPDERAN